MSLHSEKCEICGGGMKPGWIKLGMMAHYLCGLDAGYADCEAIHAAKLLGNDEHYLWIARQLFGDSR